jgi:hypothetical protein
MKNITVLSSRLISVALFVSAAASPLAMGGTITDGFEGASISPIWTALGPGTETLTSAVAHSGNQSVLLQVSASFPWNADLSHDFGSSVFGSVSVFLERPAGPSSSAGELDIFDDIGRNAVIEQLSDGSYIARINSGPSELDFPFSSSSPNAWHQLEIDTGSSGIVMKFDGTIVGTAPSFTSFRSVELDNHGGPSGSAFFDDFSATTSTSPEPSTVVLSALAALAVAASRKLRAKLVTEAERVPR